MHSAHRPNDIPVSLSHFCRSGLACAFSVGVLISITKDNCFSQCISLQTPTVQPSFPAQQHAKKTTSMPANYSFTLCDSRQSSHTLVGQPPMSANVLTRGESMCQPD